MRVLILALTLAIASSSILAATPAAAESVNLYSSRKEGIDAPAPGRVYGEDGSGSQDRVRIRRAAYPAHDRGRRELTG